MRAQFSGQKILCILIKWEIDVLSIVNANSKTKKRKENIKYLLKFVTKIIETVS